MGKPGPRPDAAARPALTPELPDSPVRGHLPGLRKPSRGHPEVIQRAPFPQGAWRGAFLPAHHGGLTV